MLKTTKLVFIYINFMTVVIKYLLQEVRNYGKADIFTCQTWELLLGRLIQTHSVSPVSLNPIC